MTSSRKPTIHLSLVTDKGSSGKFVSLESLPEEEIERTKHYHKRVAPHGVLIGVIRGALSWDLRPLILQDGVVTVTRFFSKELLQSESASDHFKSYNFNVEHTLPGVQRLQCGSGEGHAWVTRKYFGRLLSDGVLNLAHSDRIQLVSEFLQQIKKIHDQKLIHGHIVPSNIALEEDSLVLIDHGFQIFDPGSARSTTFAPELRQGIAGHLNASPASDLYGIGLVLKSIFGNQANGELLNLIEVLLLADPSLRPSLEQVMQFFDVKTEVKVTDLTAPPQLVSKDQTKRSVSTISPFLWLIPLLISFLLTGFFISHYLSSWSQKSDEQLTELREYWESKQPALMEKVVREALEGDAGVQQLILDSVLNGNGHPAIKRSLFMRAFFPLWEGELTEEDIRTVYVLGLSSLVPEQYKRIEGFDHIHPGVVAALLSTLDLKAVPESLANIPLSKLQKLPPPFGPSFAAMQKFGYTDLSSVPVQALIHILFGETDPIFVKGLFVGETETARILAKVELLLPLLDTINGFDTHLYKVVSTLGTEDLFFSWFERDIVAGWKVVTPVVKLKAFAGYFPQQELTFEQLVDLLRFPRASLRSEAKDKLLAGVIPLAQSDLVTFLSMPTNTLTRSQTISLLAALSVKGPRDLEFVNQWFKTIPDSESVVQILLNRSIEDQGLDIFSIQAARFLFKHPVEIGFEDLQKLTFHSEPLVRWLAYSKLKRSVPEEKALLLAASKREPEPRLKQSIEILIKKR